ncbi:MAG: signal peptidase II [Chlamydiales bacterium]|nr:signal peptidase II [Chlamydiales bacterium]NCF70707.1 signal peptidase II [Chlamydiales bacterium]
MSFNIRLLLLGIVIIVLDQLTKHLTNCYLPLSTQILSGYPYAGVGVFHNVLGIDFTLTHVANKGAAWGAFASYQDGLNIFRVLVIALLLIYTFFRPKAKIYHYPLVFISFGAIGNVIDYFYYGYVIDMFKFVIWGYHYPVFNIADSFIFIGVCWFFLLSFFIAPKES